VGTPKTRNRIGRNIYETHCIGSRYDPDAHKVVQFNEIVNGNIKTIERAANVLRKRFNTKQLIVEEIHHFKTYVSAPLDKFLAIVDERTEQEID
jgi:hypothetical protein